MPPALNRICAVEFRRFIVFSGDAAHRRAVEDNGGGGQGEHSREGDGGKRNVGVGKKANGRQSERG